MHGETVKFIYTSLSFQIHCSQISYLLIDTE